MISIDQIKHLEELSCLEFSEEERQKFAFEFDSIVEFASLISNANVEGKLEYKKHKLCDLREDKAKVGLTQEEVVKNAPQKEKGCFVVPQIME